LPAKKEKKKKIIPQLDINSIKRSNTYTLVSIFKSHGWEAVVPVSLGAFGLPSSYSCEPLVCITKFSGESAVWQSSQQTNKQTLGPKRVTKPPPGRDLNDLVVDINTHSCVLLCFIKPILGNRYVRSWGFIVSEPRETHPRPEIADIPTSSCPPLDKLGCPDPHPPP